MNKIIAICSIMILSLFLASCAMLPGYSENTVGKRATTDNAAKTDTNKFIKRKSAKEIESIRKKLIEGAELFKGAKNLVARGRSFNMDCSGIVAAIYYYAGIDLQKYYPHYSGTGTERIYATLKERKLLKKTYLPEPGDIIFWDNTFDRNRNKKDDDLLTHMGMVVSCDRQGNITYIHY
ncbi:MAG: hypothetical protein FWE72_03090, partial [Spirochaetaceae bacterium]|nr:hypothetical protein [Spirochaetaceae bacterium]